MRGGVAFGLSNNIVNRYVPAHTGRNTEAASASHISSDKEHDPPNGEASELYKGRMIEARRDQGVELKKCRNGVKGVDPEENPSGGQAQ